MSEKGFGSWELGVGPEGFAETAEFDAQRTRLATVLWERAWDLCAIRLWDRRDLVLVETCSCLGVTPPT
jgi:hypothetical protein